MTSRQKPDRPLSDKGALKFASGGRGNYDIVVALFCAFLLISNIGATKLIQLGPAMDVGSYPLFPLITDGGAILFPLTYIFGDILAEVYGMAKARRAILLGFVISAIAAVVFLAVDVAPPADEWPNQDAWHAVLGFVPRIVIASLIGYLAGQLLNTFVLVRMKMIFREGTLWARLLGSTLAGELVDTMLFCLVAWWGISAGMMTNYIVTGYIYKVAVEVILMPVTYRVIKTVKAREPDYGPVG